MKQKIEKMQYSELKGDKYSSKLFRIIDQSLYDDVSKIGTCFVVAMISAIESKYQKEVTEEEIEDFYEKGERMFSGFSKASYALKLASVLPIKIGENKVFATKRRKKAVKNLSFQAFSDFVSRNECTIASFGINSSFYSSMTGKFYKSYKIKGGHAVRVFEDGGKIFLVNSYGEKWARGGFVEVKEEDFKLWNLWELVGCDFS